MRNHRYRPFTTRDGSQACADCNATESEPVHLVVGDLVEVLDEGLAMLRRLCPDQPPNHHGRVYELKGDDIFVEFPLDGGYEHSQVAPYPANMVRKRSA